MDNSTNPLDPSAGDVYVSDMGHHVVDKFTANGDYISQVTGTATYPFEELFGIAVDPSGNLWVQGTTGSEISHNRVKEYTDALVNEFVSETEMRFKYLGEANERSFLGPIGFAIDSEGSFYFGQSAFLVGSHPPLSPSSTAQVRFWLKR